MNTKKFHNASRGFTLIELLVVVAIISLLSSVVFASLNTARAKARNVKRLQDISSYALAAELAYDQDGEYPDPGNTNNYCLGDYPSNTCWTDADGDGVGDGGSESGSVHAALSPYLPSLPAGNLVSGSTYPPGYVGYLYTCSVRTNNLCESILIRWFMEGINQSCGPGALEGTRNGTSAGKGNYGGLGITYCELVK